MWGRSLRITKCKLSSRPLPHTCCTTSTTQHAEDQDRWNLEKDGRTPSSTRPPLSSLSSQLFFLYKRWYVQHIPHNLLQTPEVLEFKWISLLITKTKLKEPCQPTLCTPCAFMNKLAYSLFLAFFLVLLNIYFHRDPMVSKWLSNVIWLDERNHALPCKVLRISFQKKSSIACLLKLMKTPTKAKVRFSCSILHMLFDFALSFVKFFDPC